MREAAKLIECHVAGADSQDTARTAAKAVICSNLFKAAMFGADANWGRVLCALGYSGAPMDMSRVDVQFTSQARHGGGMCRYGGHPLWRGGGQGGPLPG